MKVKLAAAVLLSSMAAQAADVDVSNATVRLPLPGKTLSAAYLSMKNQSAQPVALLAVRSPWFESIELHQHAMVDGMMRMQQIDNIEVPAGETVHLQPGGLHLMLFGPKQSLSLEHQVPLELQWSDGTIQLLKATVTKIPKQ